MGWYLASSGHCRDRTSNQHPRSHLLDLWKIPSSKKKVEPFAAVFQWKGSTSPLTVPIRLRCGNCRSSLDTARTGMVLPVTGTSEFERDEIAIANTSTARSNHVAADQRQSSMWSISPNSSAPVNHRLLYLLIRVVLVEEILLETLSQSRCCDPRPDHCCLSSRCWQVISWLRWRLSRAAKFLTISRIVGTGRTHELDVWAEDDHVQLDDSEDRQDRPHP